jgi:hypothetical protein
VKQFITLSALALLALSAACGGSSKDSTAPRDSTVTPPPPPPPPGPPAPPPPPPPPGTTASVFAAGNIGRCPVNGGAEKTARLIDSSAAAVLVLGNIASPVSTAGNIACGFAPFWERFSNKWYATMGNLDVTDTTNGARNAPDFYSYFGSRAGPSGQGWYSFDLNGWHIVVLNTEGGVTTYNSTSDQQKWLATDLAANTAKCTMAVFHRAFVYSGTNGASINSNLGSIWSKLMAGGVDVVVTGGQYSYERMNPINSAGAPDANAGIPQFNVGMGGGTSTAGAVNGKHPASAFWSGATGVLKLDLSASSATYSYIALNADGVTSTVADTGTIACK